jgi:hypothetical protein
MRAAIAIIALLSVGLCPMRAGAQTNCSAICTTQCATDSQPGFTQCLGLLVGTSCPGGSCQLAPCNTVGGTCCICQAPLPGIPVFPYYDANAQPLDQCLALSRE